jgi:hypothetical protein
MKPGNLPLDTKLGNFKLPKDLMDELTPRDKDLTKAQLIQLQQLNLTVDDLQALNDVFLKVGELILSDPAAASANNNRCCCPCCCSAVSS